MNGHQSPQQPFAAAWSVTVLAAILRHANQDTNLYAILQRQLICGEAQTLAYKKTFLNLASLCFDALKHYYSSVETLLLPDESRVLNGAKNHEIQQKDETK